MFELAANPEVALEVADRALHHMITTELAAWGLATLLHQWLIKSLVLDLVSLDVYRWREFDDEPLLVIDNHYWRRPTWRCWCALCPTSSALPAFYGRAHGACWHGADPHQDGYRTSDR